MVDRLGCDACHPWDLKQLLNRCRVDPFYAAKVPEEYLTPDWANARYAIER